MGERPECELRDRQLLLSVRLRLLLLEGPQGPRAFGHGL